MTKSHLSGMPAPITPQQLQSALTASMAETEGFRHGGPKPATNLQSTSSTPQSTSFAPQPPYQDLARPGETTFYPTQHTAVYGQDQQMVPTGLTPLPTLYVKKCTKCEWSSIPTYDGNAYSGAVSDYDSHMKESHPDPKTNDDAPSRSKDNEEFIAATRPRKVEECEDDGVVNLCKARFFSSPLSWKNSQLSLPLAQVPVCTVGDYEPFGIEVNNRPLLKDLHKLDNKNLKLKHFTDANLTLVPNMQDTVLGFEKGQSGRLFTSKAWKDIANTRDAMKAALNYMELTRSIHPLYSGPQILFKVCVNKNLVFTNNHNPQVMFEKYMLGVATPANLASFFGSVTWELANRAARSELPYRYQELMNKWDTAYGSAAVSAYMDNTAFDRKVAESLKRVAPSSSTHMTTPKKPRKPNSWCPMFNTPAGCTNTKRDAGCTDESGGEWKHGCNARVKGRPCNKTDHCRVTHVD